MTNSIGRDAVDEDGSAHAGGAGGFRGLPVEAGLDALWACDFNPRDRQIDRVRGEGEAGVRPEAVVELQLTGRAVDGLGDQRADKLYARRVS